MILTFPAKEFKSMLPKIREFTSSSLIPSARVSTSIGTSSSPLNCTSSVEIKKDTMLKFVVINKYYLAIYMYSKTWFNTYVMMREWLWSQMQMWKASYWLVCFYSFKKSIQNKFWFLVAVWRENVLLLWNYNVQYLL